MTICQRVMNAGTARDKVSGAYAAAKSNHLALLEASGGIKAAHRLSSYHANRSSQGQVTLAFLCIVYEGDSQLPPRYKLFVQVTTCLHVYKTPFSESRLFSTSIYKEATKEGVAVASISHTHTEYFVSLMGYSPRCQFQRVLSVLLKCQLRGRIKASMGSLCSSLHKGPRGVPGKLSR